MDEHDRKPNRDVVDGEVVAEFEDNTLMNLPSVEEDDTQPLSAPPQEDSARRQFMRRITIGGVAALALGGSTALLVSQRRREPTVVVLPNGGELALDPDTSDAASLLERIADLEYQLASVTAERDQLLSVLNAEGGEYESLLDELESLRAQLDAERHINSLWEAMDEMGLDVLLASSLGIIGAALDTFLGIIDTLKTGVAKGETALTNFIRQLPGPAEGLAWLKDKIERLGVDMDWLDQQLQEVVENANQFTAKITEFVLWVLDRLPFGAGDRARASLDAMEAVVNSLPELRDRVANDVLDPLSVWFDDAASGSIYDILLDPMDQHLVKPSRNTLAGFTAFQNAYNERLVAPVKNLLDERAAIRTQVQDLQARRGEHV